MFSFPSPHVFLPSAHVLLTFLSNSRWFTFTRNPFQNHVKQTHKITAEDQLKEQCTLARKVPAHIATLEVEEDVERLSLSHIAIKIVKQILKNFNTSFSL
jgi:hypothetical protein